MPLSSPFRSILARRPRSARSKRLIVSSASHLTVASNARKDGIPMAEHRSLSSRNRELNPMGTETHRFNS
ncbi:MAG: hypothetical protein AAF633_05995 [Chloroflexota bacterium]